MKEIQHLCLIDHMAELIGCEYIGDLPMMAAKGDSRITGLLKQFSAQDYSLRDWNNALEYLVQKPAQMSQEAAYELLISTLSAKKE